MRKTLILLVVVSTAGFCNATYTWEPWTTGDFASKDFTTDQGCEMTGGYGNMLRFFENSIGIINDTDSVGIQDIVTNHKSLLYLFFLESVARFVHRFFF